MTEERVWETSIHTGTGEQVAKSISQRMNDTEPRQVRNPQGEPIMYLSTSVVLVPGEIANTAQLLNSVVLVQLLQRSPRLRPVGSQNGGER